MFPLIRSDLIQQGQICCDTGRFTLIWSDLFRYAQIYSDMTILIQYVISVLI